MKCEEKKRYESRAEAKKALRILNRRFRDKATVFLCPHCGFWHRGHHNPIAEGFHQVAMESNRGHRFYHHFRVQLFDLRQHGFGSSLFRALGDLVMPEEARRLLGQIEQPLKYEEHPIGALLHKYPLRAPLLVNGEHIGDVFLAKDAVAQGRFSA